MIELHNLHNSLRVLFLLRLGDTAVLEKLLPFLGQPRELSGRRVEADVGKMNGIIRRANLWPLGTVEEVRHEVEYSTLLGLG